MAGFISFDYKCTNTDCAQFEKIDDRIHRRDEEQVCKECKGPVEKLVSFPGGARGRHVSWSLWQV